MPAIPTTEIVFVDRPKGLPTADTFAMRQGQAPEPGAGEIQVKNQWLSVDPYMRARMDNRRSYIPPFQPGQVLEGQAVGEVLASNADGFAPGDLVMSMYGWRDAWTANPRGAAPHLNVTKLETFGLPPQAFLGVAGATGLTAWAGLLHVGKVKEGETVFVSAAAGAVGSVVCQIAKAKGCRVIGSAGGPEKVAFLKDIGCDEAIDYKQAENGVELTKMLAAAAPDGIDLYFENVGGDHLFAALNAMKDFGRIVVCGMIAVYNEPQPGPPNLPLIITRRLRVEGFVVTDYMTRTAEFAKDMSEWLMSGKIQGRETVIDGVENAPAAFLSLFEGGNMGKMLVKVA